jgi:hypothetical protein
MLVVEAEAPAKPPAPPPSAPRPPPGTRLAVPICCPPGHHHAPGFAHQRFVNWICIQRSGGAITKLGQNL